MFRRAAIGTTAIVLIVIIVVGAIGVLVIASQAGTSSTTAQSSHTSSTTQTSLTENQISLRNFYLQVNGSAPGYPGTLLAGEIYVNASVPWSSYTLYINNTYCSTRTFPNSTLTQFIYQFKGGLTCIPVTARNTYLIKFVVSFTDGTNATSTTSVTAE